MAATAGSLPQVRTLGSRIGVAIWSGIGFFGLSLVIVGIASTGGIYQYLPATAPWLGLLYLLLLGGMTLAGWRAGCGGRFLLASAVGIGAMVSWCWMTLACVVPASRDLWVSPRLATVLDNLSPAADAPIALVGYEEDSVVFLLRGKGERVRTRDIYEWVHAHPTGIVVVETLARTGGRHEAGDLLDSRDVIEGFNYSIGRRVRLEVYAPRTK